MGAADAIETVLADLLGAEPSPVVRRDPAGRNRRERRHLDTLTRRAAYLGEQIAGGDYRGRDYDKAEQAALLWALSRITDAEEASAARELSDLGGSHG